MKETMVLLARIASRVDENLLQFLTKQYWYKVLHWAHSSEDPNNDGRYTTALPEEANVVSSMVDTGDRFQAHYLHRPVLDIDMPVYVVESSTPGHHHLFIDKEMTWDQYQRFLEALVAVGIVEQGYLATAIKRGATMVRLPWVKK